MAALPTSSAHPPEQQIDLLIGALARHDQATATHSLRVARLSERIALQLGLSAAERATLRRGALLHDMGKLLVSRAILCKPGALSGGERQIIEGHPVYGEQMLAPLRLEPTVYAVVRSHHERYDGAGYPFGLRGSAIPLAARVVAVADCFDAMTSSRSYRAALDSDTAMQLLQRGSGQQWDGEVVAALDGLVNPARERALGEPAPPMPYTPPVARRLQLAGPSYV